MRVLLMGSDAKSQAEATEVLERDGHDVVRCHEPDAPAFPCSAMGDTGQCPLDQHTVHAAVLMTEVDGSGDSASEDGARCALRRHIPLVAVDQADTSPLRGWASESIAGTDQLGEAVDRAAAGRLSSHEVVACEVFRRVLDANELHDVALDVVATRVERGVRAELWTSVDVPLAVTETASVRVLGALRKVDAHASTVTVVVGGSDPLLVRTDV